jgi:hypothetical protein
MGHVPFAGEELQHVSESRAEDDEAVAGAAHFRAEAVTLRCGGLTRV